MAQLEPGELEEQENPVGRREGRWFVWLLVGLAVVLVADATGVLPGSGESGGRTTAPDVLGTVVTRPFTTTSAVAAIPDAPVGAEAPPPPTAPPVAVTGAVGPTTAPTALRTTTTESTGATAPPSATTIEPATTTTTEPAATTTTEPSTTLAPPPPSTTVPLEP